jgi:hypothetical protein
LRPSSWRRLAQASWNAGLEAQQVIGLRLARLARGGKPAAAEARRMLAEKAEAAWAAQLLAAEAILGGKAASLPARTIALYRRRMRANAKRLAKPRRAAKGKGR